MGCGHAGLLLVGWLGRGRAGQRGMSANSSTGNGTTFPLQDASTRAVIGQVSRIVFRDDRAPIQAFSDTPLASSEGRFTSLTVSSVWPWEPASS